MFKHSDLFIRGDKFRIRIRFHDGIAMEQLLPLQEKLRVVKSYNDILEIARQAATETGQTYSITTFDDREFDTIDLPNLTRRFAA
jgi:hypothetical protein